MVLAALLALQLTMTGQPIGVAGRAGPGALCVAIDGPRLTAGAVVVLVQPHAEQTALQVRIEREAATCETLERALVKGPYYVARPADPTHADAPVWVAFAGEVESRTLPSGTVAVRLNDAYPNAQVRSCTSKEGLHLTVWTGTPLKSQRLWHRYFYLGYDVEPTCQDADIRQSAI